MNYSQLMAIREIAEENSVYNKETKTLTIKTGIMAGRYENISYESAKEIVKVNGK